MNLVGACTIMARSPTQQGRREYILHYVLPSFDLSASMAMVGSLFPADPYAKVLTFSHP